MGARMQLDDQADVRMAVANSASSGAVVGTLIDTTGFGRVRFLFNLGGQAGTGSLVTNLGVWKASTSGATFTSNTRALLAARTSGVISGGIVAVIDVATDPDKPWVQISGSMSLADIYHGVIAELYHPVNKPVSASANQIVVN